MVYRPPLLLGAYIAAVVGGTLLAIGSWLGGAALIVVALVLAAARYIVDRRGEDDTFTLW